MLGKDEFLLGSASGDMAALKPLAFSSAPRAAAAAALDKAYKQGKISAFQWRMGVRTTRALVADYEKSTGLKYVNLAQARDELVPWVADAVQNKAITYKQFRTLVANTSLVKADYERLTGKKWPHESEWYEKVAKVAVKAAVLPYTIYDAVTPDFIKNKAKEIAAENIQAVLENFNPGFSSVNGLRTLRDRKLVLSAYGKVNGVSGLDDALLRLIVEPAAAVKRISTSLGAVVSNNFPVINVPAALVSTGVGEFLKGIGIDSRISDIAKGLVVSARKSAPQAFPKSASAFIKPASAAAPKLTIAITPSEDKMQVYYWLGGWKKYASSSNISANDDTASFTYKVSAVAPALKATGKRIDGRALAAFGALAPLAGATYYQRTGGVGPVVFAVTGVTTIKPASSAMTLEQMKAATAAKAKAAAAAGPDLVNAGLNKGNAPTAQAGVSGKVIVLGAAALALMLMRKKG